MTPAPTGYFLRMPERLPENVTAWSSGLWQTRSTLVRTAEGGVLFDPCYFPREIEEIAAAVDGIPGERERGALVFTHSDWDHVVGFPRFAGWRTVAHAAVAAKDDAARGKILGEIRDLDEKWYVQREHDYAYPRVDVAIPDEREGELAGEPVLFVPAIGHTDDGLATLFPRLRLAVVGDLLSALEFPFVYHSAVAYRASLVTIAERLREHGITHLVPGHGPAATSRAEIERRVADDLDYLDRLFDAVTRDPVAAESMAFRGKPIAGAQLDFHRTNIAIARRELVTP